MIFEFPMHKNPGNQNLGPIDENRDPENHFQVKGLYHHFLPTGFHHLKELALTNLLLIRTKIYVFYHINRCLSQALNRDDF